MNWYKKFWSDFATFNGRSRREEYWTVFLINFVISILLGFLGGVPGVIYSIAALIPGIALSVRRLHDTGRSGIWLLLVFIPFIGAIIVLILMALEGDSNENEYGASPK